MPHIISSPYYIPLLILYSIHIPAIYYTCLNGTRHALYLPCNSQDSFPVAKLIGVNCYNRWYNPS